MLGASHVRHPNTLTESMTVPSQRPLGWLKIPRRGTRGRGTRGAAQQAPTSKQALRGMLRSVLDPDRVTVARRPSAAELTSVTSHERTRAVLSNRLAPGSSASEALIGCVRDLARHGNFAEARSVTRAARRMPSLRPAARAAAAVTAVSQGRFEAAAKRLGGLSGDAALQLVPAEVVAVEFAKNRAAGVAAAAAVLNESLDVSAEAMLEIARQAFAYDELELSKRALNRFEGGQASVSTEVRAEHRWLRRWIRLAGRGQTAPPLGSNQVALAVLDYKLPDYRRTSANVGDYIQTLASLGHLVRHRGLRFSGDPALVERLNALRARIAPDDRLAATDRDVALVPVNRDASSLDAIPEGTWMLACGWYMHGWFRVRYDFPFHPRLRPLFVSFHVNRPGMLTEEGVAYLQESAPIGCRDWDTVRRLQELHVPAFFSGCVTSTVDLLFPSRPDPPADAPVAFVDMPEAASAAGKRAISLHHADLEIRADPLAANLDRAVRTLDAYRSEVGGIETTRLHCYLPARALGVDVRFHPRRADDPRFEGLIGIDDASFAAMRKGIRGKLEAVLTSILRGDDERTVRATWREVCRPDVEDARAANPQTRSM
jgi:hypothetical protein